MDGEISPENLEAALVDGDAPLVVDIRQPGLYRQARIPDSVNLPLPDLVGGVEDVADADHVVTVCPHGQASIKAARLIASYEGFDGDVESLEGGLTAWDGPITSGEENSAREEAAESGSEAPF
ncbi:MAG: rhodanese-like domain-containing protein [Haloarculaceae archaeon]